MVIYNLTGMVSANNIVDMTLEANILSNGIMIASTLMILFIVYMVVYKAQSMKKVMLGGSFFLTIVATYAFVIGFIGMNVLIIPIILTFTSLIMYYFMR